jgi:RNA polymerase sigma-70 factor (ECF subfamily)
LATDDRQLLKRAREYDAQVLAEIYDQHAEPIYRYVYRYVGDASLAEDLTSEVFLRLVQVIGTPRAPRDQLRGWLYRVAHNLAMDHFRQRAKGTPLPLDEDLVPGSDSPSAKVEKDQAQQRVRQAVGQLTPSQQQVLVLRFGEGLKIREIGQLMGKSEGSIKLMQYRALQRLRKLFDQDSTDEHDTKRS